MEQGIANPFSQHEENLAEFARSMSHPARIRIVTLFLEAKSELCCGEIVKRLPLAQSTVSQHLSELVKTGILTMRKDRQTSCYKLNADQLLNFCRSFQIAMGNPPQK